MIGFLIGIICGAIELCLLVLLMRALQEERGGRLAGLLAVKLLVLAFAFFATIMIDTKDILWCGIGTTLVLVVGAFILSRRYQKTGKGDIKHK